MLPALDVLGVQPVVTAMRVLEAGFPHPRLAFVVTPLKRAFPPTLEPNLPLKQ